MTNYTDMRMYFARKLPYLPSKQIDGKTAVLSQQSGMFEDNKSTYLVISHICASPEIFGAQNCTI